MTRIWNFFLSIYLCVVCTSILGIVVVDKWQATGGFLNFVLEIVSNEKNH